MSSIKNWMLGAAIVAGALGLGATTAQAAEVGIYVRGPVAYVPPCPGPGYVWIAGYYSDGYWIPGRWSFGGYGYRDRDDFRRYDRDRDRAYYRGRDFYRDRNDWRHDRDEDRSDRDRDWNRDRDHDRR